MSIDRCGTRPVVTPYSALPFHLGQGWGAYELTCNACGHAFVLVAPVGIMGYDCPDCSYHHDNSLMERTDNDMPFIDGPWLGNPIDLSVTCR